MVRIHTYPPRTSNRASFLALSVVRSFFFAVRVGMTFQRILLGAVPNLTPFSVPFAKFAVDVFNEL